MCMKMCVCMCVCMHTSLIVILHLMSIHIDFGVNLGTTKSDEPGLRGMRGATEREGRESERGSNYEDTTHIYYVQVIPKEHHHTTSHDIT